MGFITRFMSHLNESLFVLPTLLFLVAIYVLFIRNKKSNMSKPQQQKQQQQATHFTNYDPSEEVDGLMDEWKLVPPLFPEDLDHVPFTAKRFPPEEMLQRVNQFYMEMNQRRSVRFFSTEEVPKEIVEKIIITAGTSPSGAHTEPWTYVVVRDVEVKQCLREIVENEEAINYSKRMGDQWVNDLRALRTSHVKEYLTTAPWIIVVFRQMYTPLPNGKRRTHYYHEISTSLSVGILLAAIQNCGLVTLTSTPLNCGPAIRTLLGRPSHEKLMFLLPLGFPAVDATVPDLQRKPLHDIMFIV